MTGKEKTIWLAALGIALIAGGLMFDSVEKQQNPSYGSDSWQKWMTVGLIGAGGISLICGVAKYEI